MLTSFSHVAFLISYSDAGDNKQYKGEKGEERDGKVAYKGEEGRECGKQQCIAQGTVPASFSIGCFLVPFMLSIGCLL